MTNRLIAELRQALKPGEMLELTIWPEEAEDGSNEEGVSFAAAIYRIEPEPSGKKGGEKYLVEPPQSALLKLKDKIVPPLVIGALYGDAASPFVFYPTLEAVESIKTKGYWLSFPPTMAIESIQRRSFVRVKARVPVILANDEEMPAYTVDISGGGLQFTCAKQYTPGASLSLKIRFDTESPLDWLTARVVKSGENPLTRRAEEAFATACQFVDLNESVRQKIVGECFKVEVWARKHLQA